MAGLRTSLLARRIGAPLATAVLATAVLVTAVLVTAGPVGASTGWQVAFQAHAGPPATANGLIGVTALTGNDAWAVGGTYPGQATAGAPIAEHWNGTAWRAVPLPGTLTGALGAVSAPATTDVWTVSQLTGYALHWNGTAWSVAKTWPESLQAPRELTGVTAFSPADVWVFGAPGAHPGLGTWHLHGTTWTKVTGLAGGISTASALSPTSMWAISSDGAAPDDILLRYNGATWQRITSAALSGQGEWFSAVQSSSRAPMAEHRSFAGIWSSYSLPGGGQASGMALIPGTTSLWATGSVPSSGGTGADEVIWSGGPAAWVPGAA